MKKFLNIFFIFLIVVSLNAKSIVLSPLPLPTAEVLDIELDECNEVCLKELLENGEVFSFLAKAYDKNLDDEILKENFQLLCNILNIQQSLIPIEKINIAVLTPNKKIGKYAISTTKSIIAYLLSKNIRFHLKTFDIEDENYETLLDAVEKISDENFEFIIAPLTLEGAKNLSQIETDIKIYIPTINKNDILEIENNSIIFGGIDYKAQIDNLLQFSSPKITIFYDSKSRLTYKLTNIVENESNVTDINIIEIKDEATNLKRYFYKNEDLNSSSIFLNTPIIKSSLILSQLTLYDIKPVSVLSTQINYNPLIFSLTQPIDRENLIIANSIHGKSHSLEEINSLINNDITFNWINYSTSIGIDYFFNKKSNQKRLFDENIENNQVIYFITTEKALYGRFFPITFEDFEKYLETQEE